VFIRYFVMAMLSPYWLEQMKMSSFAMLFFVSSVLFVLLLIIKTTVGVGLVLFSGRLHNIDLNQRLMKLAFGDKSTSPVDSGHPEESLAEIDRFTAIEGRVVG
jgi:hypothetical protein